MLKKIFSVHDVESNTEAVIKGAFIGLAIIGATQMVYDVTTLFVRKVVRDEIEKLN